MSICERIDTLYLIDLDGTIEEAIRHLQSIKDKYKDKNISLYLEGHDDNKVYSIVYYREENDIEKQTLEKTKEENYNFRRKQYEELKKEFEYGKIYINNSPL